MCSESPRFESSPTVYVGFCPQCGTGPLGLRTCGGCGEVVVVCDECDVVWQDANFTNPPASTGTTTLPCPYCLADLYDKPGHWATPAEIAASPWLTEALANSDVELSTSDSSATEADDDDDDDDLTA